MNTQQLADACNRNYVAAFAALAPHIGAPEGGARTFGHATAVVTGLARAFYNPVMVTHGSTTEEDIGAAISWVQSRGVAASVQLAEHLQARFDSMLRRLGLEPDPWVTPGMALYPIRRPPSAPAGLTIERVVPGTFNDWHQAIAYGAEFQRVYRATLVDDAAFKFVVGYVDRRPVAGAAAIVANDVVGIYAVGTNEWARGRGFGEAVTWAATQAGVEAGCEVAVLQSTEMGLPLYRRMGFVEVCRYVEYVPAAVATGQASTASR